MPKQGMRGTRGGARPARSAGRAKPAGHDQVEARTRHHARTEVARLLELLAAERADWIGGRLHALAATVALTGLRRDEALRLRVEDVHLAEGYLAVRGHGRRLKTRASAQPVPLPDQLVAVLADWLPRTGSEWVFPGVRRQGPWTGGAIGSRGSTPSRPLAGAWGSSGSRSCRCGIPMPRTAKARGTSVS